MLNVIYTWPTGDVVEWCSCEAGTVMQDVCCDYCGGLIEQGTRAVLLFHRGAKPYYLHEACAKKACHSADERARPNKHLTDYITENKE